MWVPNRCVCRKGQHEVTYGIARDGDVTTKINLRVSMYHSDDFVPVVWLQSFMRHGRNWSSLHSQST
jgi:hypothetical protein